MKRSRSFFWGRTPVLRILIPFATGIIIQWYSKPPAVYWYVLIASAFVFFIFFSALSHFNRFRHGWLQGVLLSVVFVSVGGIVAWNKDVRNDSVWYERRARSTPPLFVTLDEPLMEKERSFRVTATVKATLDSAGWRPARGKIIIYFRKDSTFTPAELDYGVELVIRAPVQPVKNQGNPGAFDFARYCLFQGITGQVFLQKDDFFLPGTSNPTLIQRLIFPAREAILKIIRKYIPGDREKGLAEALLVGYKNDLDKSLVQSYSNTGVVHVIAISGLHIGLIYWVLLLLLKPFAGTRGFSWLQPLIVIAGLWGFSLMAGGSPSVLRSAVMFTCIVAGQSFKRHGQVYNTMALSALILLCYNPYWLWDIGFQLSYAAVLSIIVFMKPVYNWIYVKNKMLDFFWQLNAVTIAAQILTLPFTIYHFHQFPNYFMLANVVAVPLSSVIVLGEILLCGLSFSPVVAAFIGSVLSWLITQMNDYIKEVESLPSALWEGIQVSLAQALFLIALIVVIGWWLMEKKRLGCLLALSSAFGFMIIDAIDSSAAKLQVSLTVYNVPGRSAIDFVSGKNFFFYGDDSANVDKSTRDFHMSPARVQRRVKEAAALDNLVISGRYASFAGREILLLDETMNFKAGSIRPVVDLVIVSGNPRLYIRRLAQSIGIRQVVFDSSVPPWRLKYWRADCDSLGIPSHDVREKGAFVMTMN